jgi:hypothetical protein
MSPHLPPIASPKSRFYGRVPNDGSAGWVVTHLTPYFFFEIGKVPGN